MKPLLTGLALFLAGIARAEAEAPKLPEIDWTVGPGKADIGSFAEIDLPKGYYFTGKKGTIKLMQLMGNLVTNHEEGFLAPGNIFEKSAREPWIVVFEFNDIGYVKDDEKKAIDSAKLLANMKEGVKEGNAERAKHGLPAMEVVGWAVEPHYHEKTNNLEWGLLLQTEKGDKVINYDVRMLGRNGVMQSTLVLSPGQLEQALPQFRHVLGVFSFKSGQKYAEYREGDRIAKIGLTALIAGGAAAAAWKFGIFKYLWKFAAVFFVGIAALFRRIWDRFFGKKETLD